MAVPLERQSINSKYWLAQKFAKQGWEEYPSREFIRFAEQHLTNKKADICHSKTLSFKNCMIRIPGSINSKSNELVTVVQKWNGIRHSIMPLLVDYYIHLASKKQKEISADNPITKRLGSILKTCHYRNGVIRWIEALLETSILENHRKYVIWRILAPYLINVKKMSYEDAYSTIRSWLGKCHSARRLDFNAKRRIDESLNKVIKNGNYLPISFSKLKLENPRLYELLCERNN
jgi:hypothetical protein